MTTDRPIAIIRTVSVLLIIGLATATAPASADEPEKVAVDSAVIETARHRLQIERAVHDTIAWALADDADAFFLCCRQNRALIRRGVDGRGGLDRGPRSRTGRISRAILARN